MEEQKIDEPKLKLEFTKVMLFTDEILELRRCANKLRLNDMITKEEMNNIEKRLIAEAQKNHIFITTPFRKVEENWFSMFEFYQHYIWEKKRIFMEKWYK